MDSKFVITADYKEGTTTEYDGGIIFSEDTYADTREEVDAVIADYLDDENVEKITIVRK